MICVKKKGIFAIVGVAIIIIVVFAVPQPTETPSMIQDSTKINDESTIGIGDEPQTPQISDEGSIEASLNVGETPTISDTAEVEAEGEYYVDENGTKHYVIKAEDSPTLN